MTRGFWGFLDRTLQIVVIGSGLWFGLVKDDYARGAYYLAFAAVSLLLDLVAQRSIRSAGGAR